MKNLKIYEFGTKISMNTNLISAKCVFKYKYNSDNTIHKRKARLVARGFKQKYEIDYNKIFSPTLRTYLLRLIAALASQYNFTFQHSSNGYKSSISKCKT